MFPLSLDHTNMWLRVVKTNSDEGRGPLSSRGCGVMSASSEVDEPLSGVRFDVPTVTLLRSRGPLPSGLRGCPDDVMKWVQ